VQSGQRTGKVRDHVRDDRIAECSIAVAILVRIDDELANLWREALDDVGDERSTVEFDESLVDAAHPATLPAGEHDTGDVGARDRHGRAFVGTRFTSPSRVRVALPRAHRRETAAHP